MATLVEQRNQLTEQREAALSEIQWMRVHLSSNKFMPELEDYINVRDVDAFCLRLREALHG